MILRQIEALAVKELKILWRDRQALALLFLMPSFFILVMSFALEGVFEAGTRSRPLEILVINEDLGPLAGRTLDEAKRIDGIRLIESGPSGPLTLDQAEAMIRDGSFRFGLRFGPHYTERIRRESAEPGGDSASTAATEPVSPGEQGTASTAPRKPAVQGPAVSLIVDPAINQQLQSVVSGTVTGIVERIRLAEQLPAKIQGALDSVREEMAAGGLEDPGPDEGEARATEVERMISDESGRLELEVTAPSGFQRERRPTATEQNVPAYAIFGVFFIVLTIAKSFLRERLDGTFVRLLTAPLPKALLIVGKLVPYYLVNLLQIALMFAIGVAVFDMKLGNFPAFIVVSLATAATANGLGLLVAACGKTEAQVDTLAVLLAITLAALGGIMVPTFVMPPLLQTLSRFTPHAWALAGYQDVMVRGLGLRDVLPEAGVLLGFAAIFLLVGLWRLRLS